MRFRVDGRGGGGYDPRRMHQRLNGSFHRFGLARAFRRGMGVVLLLGCLPSLLVNVGTGRSVLIHGHRDDSLHTHLVAVSHERDLARWHAEHEGHHRHRDDAEDHAEDDAEAHDALTQPAEPHGDTVIRGNELAVSKQHKAARVELGHLMAAAPAVLTADRWESSLLSGWVLEARGNVRRAELSSLRAVVLLI